MPTLPPFVVGPTGYDLSLPGPYLLKYVTMRAYGFDADKTTLQNTCDRYLNISDSEFKYKILGRTVLLTMLNIERVTATPESLGWMHEIDGAFQFPVLKCKKVGGVDIPVGMATFMLYLWVNSDSPLVTGRESLGFRKGLGTSFTNDDGSDPTHASQLTHVEGWVIPDRNQKLVKRRIIEIHHDPHAAEGSGWKTPFEAAQAILMKLLAGVDESVSPASDALALPDGVRVPVVFLKQLRDASEPLKACHQRVLEADGFIPASGFRGGGFLDGNHTVTLHNFISHPIRAELGLPAGSGDLHSRFAFEVDYDFEMRLP